MSEESTAEGSASELGSRPVGFVLCEEGVEQHTDSVAQSGGIPYWSVCFIDTRLYSTQFKRVLDAMRIAAENAPRDENLIMLVDYSHSEQGVRNLLSNALRASVLRGRIPGLRYVELPEAEGDDPSGFSVCYRGPDIVPQRLRISVSRPTPFEGLYFGIVYYYVQALTGVAGSYTRVGFAWCPGLATGITGLLPSDEKLDAALCLMYSQLCAESYYDQPHGADAFSRDRDAFITDSVHEFWSNTDALVIAASIRDEIDNPCLCHVWKASGKIHVSSGKFMNGEWYTDTAMRASRIRAPPIWHRFRGSRKRRIFAACHDLDRILRLRGPAVNDATCGSSGIGSLGECSTVLVESREPEHESLCILCIEEPPKFIFIKCGHLCLCPRCRKAMYCQSDRRIPMNNFKINWNKLFQSKIECPICRTPSSTIHVNKYAGAVYKC